MLTPLPLAKGTLRLAPLPLLNSAILVVKAEVAAGEPPLDGTAQGGALTPAVSVAVAHPSARIVDSLHQSVSHTPMLPRLDFLQRFLRGVTG